MPARQVASSIFSLDHFEGWRQIDARAFLKQFLSGYRGSAMITPRLSLAAAIWVFLLPALGLAQRGGTAASALVKPAAPLQSPVPVSGKTKTEATPGTPLNGSPSDPAAAKAAEEVAAQTAEAALKTQRKARIQKLTFDRRPSTILKVWSTPPESDEEAKNGEASETKPDEAANTDASPPTPDPSTERLQAFDKQLAEFQRNVTLGRWESVAVFLAEDLDEDEGKAAYLKMLTGLHAPPKGVPSQMVAYAEKPVFSVDDVFAMIQACPHDIDKTVLPFLGQTLRLSIASGNDIGKFIDRFHEVAEAGDAWAAARKADEDAKKAAEAADGRTDADSKDAKQPGKETGDGAGAEASQFAPPEAKLTGKLVAQLLFLAGQTLKAGEFLPSPDEAIASKDRDALNLLAQYLLAKHAEEKDLKFLEQAWSVTQAALSAGEITEEQKQVALARAVELAPKIREELGTAWLDESFTSRPERGMELLATIGSGVSTGLVKLASNPQQRERGLELQHTAVNALLRAAPERAEEWAETLNLLACNWLTEAEHSRKYDTTTSRRPMMQRDIYGNYFYTSSSGYSSSSSSSRTPRAIKTGRLLDLKPEGKWLEVVDDPLKPRFRTILPQLHLKVDEAEKAFPYIEEIAGTHPEVASELAEEFLRVWTSNHDPNSSRRRTSYYMFSYGFNQRAQGIPLTRSKQERNLTELAGWMKRLREIPIDDIDERILTSAFTNTHGAAEVYRLENIERVFGSIASLKPATLAQLIQKMRQNLAGVWRMPATQKNAKTNRKQKDVEAEVVRGYGVANTVLKSGMAAYPDHWQLQLAKAAMAFDENEYYNELQNSSEYSARREAAISEYRKAAELYIKAAQELEEEKQNTSVFESWFYASLGASDISQIKPETQPNLKEIAKVREAIVSMPGDLSERHMDMFANSLFTRLSAVNAAVKFRFLRAGFEIVQDNERAEEARKVFDYYNDLVTEIELVASIDGSDVVGHEEPFGVFIDLHHTKEIERESGGFAKYLQNQNNGAYYYNYGRPTENYRDKFEEACVAALDEHFEVLSVTFQREDVNSKATHRIGWRVTPYAYMLIKPRGPEVDTIPSVRLDLDFLDTSGYAVLPVETSPTPIDAKGRSPETRPLSNVTITQTLDERQSEEGKLILEVKATGRGLVPKLDELLELKPTEFDVVDVEDEGVSISQFDKESDETAIISERNFLVYLKARDNLKEHPKEFQFGRPLIAEATVEHQRYVDADLASVDPVISLEQSYGEPVSTWPWFVAGGVVLLLGVVLVFVLMSSPEQQETARRFQVPEEVTPFTVIGLLKDIESNNGLTPDRTRELAGTINRLEQYYFYERDGDEPDLRNIARDWASKAV